MADSRSAAQSRLTQIKDFLTMNKTAATIPFDPDSTKFPQRKDVPVAQYSPQGVPTAWVWGENDMVHSWARLCRLGSDIIARSVV